MNLQPGVTIREVDISERVPLPPHMIRLREVFEDLVVLFGFERAYQELRDIVYAETGFRIMDVNMEELGIPIPDKHKQFVCEGDAYRYRLGI